MLEKLEIYDVLGVLVPGILIVCAIPLSFPPVVQAIADAKLPDGFAFVGLTAASIFAGNLIQAIASLVEGFLNWSWGGRPSERALETGLGDRYFPAATAARIRAKLAAVAEPNASSRSLFLFAMQRAESMGSARVQRFNALYAYHRALVVLSALVFVLFIVSFRGGLASRLTFGQSAWILVLLALLLLLSWHRAKQRGYYYVREVLLSAEQQLPSSTASPAHKGG